MATRPVTIHSTNCHNYVVTLDDARPAENQLCRSLEQVYDVLRSHGVADAVLAQRLPFDEIAGAPMDGGLSYMPIKVPARRGP